MDPLSDPTGQPLNSDGELDRPRGVSLPGEDLAYSGVTKGLQPFESGDHISLENVGVVANRFNSFGRVDLHVLGETVLALGAQFEDRIEIHGTAILVAPGLALTAQHVITELNDFAGLNAVVAVSPRSNGTIAFWHVVDATSQGEFDASILNLRPMSDLKEVINFKLPTLNIRLPRVGEWVSVVGYKQLSMPTGETVDLNLLHSSGKVTAVYPSGRDRVMLPGPCVELDLTVLGGMSGGPAFDENGRMIGVASTSLEGEVTKPSFVTLIWPTVFLDFPTSWPPGMYAPSTSLKALAGSFVSLFGAEDAIAHYGPGDTTRYSIADRGNDTVDP